jgi:hypothetical protein
VLAVLVGRVLGGAGDGDGRATGKVQDILEIHICIS